MCNVLQIVKRIAESLFVYGNMFDAVKLLLKLLKRPDVRYLVKYDNADYRDHKHVKAVDSVISNIKVYLSELMAVKGSRTKLTAQTFRTVVSACSGPNL